MPIRSHSRISWARWFSVKFILPFKARLIAKYDEDTLIFPSAKEFYERFNGLQAELQQAQLENKDSVADNLQGQLNAFKWFIEYGRTWTEGNNLHEEQRRDE